MRGTPRANTGRQRRKHLDRYIDRQIDMRGTSRASTGRQRRKHQDIQIDRYIDRQRGI